MLTCCVSRRLVFIHIPFPLLNMMAITLTVTNLNRCETERVNGFLRGYCQREKKAYMSFFGLFIREKEAASFTEMFIYLSNIWKSKYSVMFLEKDELGEPGKQVSTASSCSWTLTQSCPSSLLLGSRVLEWLTKPSPHRSWNYPIRNITLCISYKLFSSHPAKIWISNN